VVTSTVIVTSTTRFVSSRTNLSMRLRTTTTQMRGAIVLYKPETLEVLKKQVAAINKLSEVMRVIDYLYSSDYGEDTFLEAMRKLEGHP